ncbi:helix-turn-helix domain-containing protein [Corynebacterium oculi]|uniref:Helix-turn-helix protein n=1 Tax=Corynebacterium oculi TaxID=1544416 RepID=A0A0Q0YDH9_9CORY|nr:helix-turn-helix transcriptional regulator [Corynebacterium oculi]KQB84368.1 helix-turn-helix protein [Corynebacterium oculi]
MSTIPTSINHALKAAKISQRGLAARTGISQTTLSRIISGDRAPTMPEVILIADATGHTVAQLTGTALEQRVQYAARTTNNADAAAMRERLLHFIEIDSYLEDQGIIAEQ